MRKDGLLIASSLPEETGRKGVWTASAKIMNATEACSDELGKGELRQIILETEKGRIISLSAGKDAFLLCVARKDALLGQLLLDIPRIHLYFFFDPIRGIERDLVQKSFHDGVQPARADILRALIHQGGDLGDLGDRLFRKKQGDPLGGQ